MLHDNIAALQKSLNDYADPKTQKFWTSYMKGAASFRGVSMKDIRRCVHAWWLGRELSKQNIRMQKKMACMLFEEVHTEDRLAGIIVLSEIIFPSLTSADISSFAQLFQRGYIADWNVCDWFCIKVLGNLIRENKENTRIVDIISSWRYERSLWQRRATCVSFVQLAQYGEHILPGLPDIILRNAEFLVKDTERFAQTAVGWVLRELSCYDRTLTVQFAERNITYLSREAIHSLAEKMPKKEKQQLLMMHKQLRITKK